MLWRFWGRNYVHKSVEIDFFSSLLRVGFHGLFRLGPSTPEPYRIYLDKS
jgi:hypothetical protein